MPVKNALKNIALTQPDHLQTLTENRRIFNLQNCELNVFESYEPCYRVPLTFGDFVITSMVRGKKIMHLFDRAAFEYLPGESVIVPAATDEKNDWQLQFSEYHFNNDTDITKLINKLILILQRQHLHLLSEDCAANNNRSRLRKAYQSRNIFFKWFKEQFGLTPGAYRVICRK